MSRCPKRSSPQLIRCERATSTRRAPAVGNLPAAFTSFVNREREMEAIAEALAESRLITLAGVGGAGKTRLALEAAALLADRYAGGVWLAELGPVSDPDLVPQAVARALDVRERPDAPAATTLCDALRDRELLLVLDNCEHVLGAARALALALLAAAPHLRVLATSVEPLGAAGERVLTVPPLGCPDPRELPPDDTIRRYAAVRLFLDRAAAVAPALTAEPGAVAEVARICHRLDGLPLAIELAAARVRVLGVTEISERLCDRFRLLRAPGRDGPPRHQTLRALLDWSHDLLTDAERALFRRLALFAGSFDIGAVEAVGAGDELPVEEVLDHLAALAEKSLVVVEHSGGRARYRLLQSVREYARERLADAGEETAVRARHLAWCLALAEQAQPALAGAAQAEWLAHPEASHGDLRDALEWALEERPADAMLLADRLRTFSRTSGQGAEASSWLQRAVERDPGPPGAAPAPGALFRREGDYWSISWGGARARMRHTKGLGYLAALLARPGGEVHVADLVAAAEGCAPRTAGWGDAASLGVEGDTGAVLDERARRAYRDRVADLEAEIAEAEGWGDAQRACKARDERDAIAAELTRAYGLGGRARRTGDPGERMRKAVGNRIREAVARISAEVPALGRHLENAITTGIFCAYTPERAVDWRL
ncbi:MAG: hypothetical protein HY775_02775 [Acidobacteria bacterium]|nr:hypothetical protein [Acidobacteriota bacterium]